MSRSNPTTRGANPCTRWFQISGGEGLVTYYDKEKDEVVQVGPQFQFLLLDELATVGGFNEATQSGIYANEVRDTRTDPFVVRTFAGQALGNGLYASIREKLAVAGGKYAASCYIAYKDEKGGLSLGNIRFMGSSLAAWSNFKRDCGTVDVNGKRVKAFYADAVRIDGFKRAKKGNVIYHVPQFALRPIPPEVNELANKLDAQLQEFLEAYVQRRIEESTDDPDTSAE